MSTHKLKARIGGSIAIGVLMIAAVVLELGAATLFFATGNIRRGVREENLTMLLHGAEAGIDFECDAIWRTFKETQTLETIDTAASGADESDPLVVNNGTFNGPAGDTGAQIRYTVAVIGCTVTDSYTRDLTIRSVAWLDENNNGVWDAGEPARSIICQVRYTLSRSGVFDYAYFVNNYGWMTGFGPSDLVVNGDMRANGNFDFSGGSPTINGSVYAAANNLLIPGAAGIVNITPSQWSNSYYASVASPQARQAYDPAIHGVKGSQTYENWRDVIYDQDGRWSTARPPGRSSETIMALAPTPGQCWTLPRLRF